MNILLTSFGSWQILPELLGFTNAQAYPLYADSLYAETRRHGIVPADELWVISTALNGQTREGFERFSAWHARHAIIPFRWFAAADIDDINNQYRSRQMRELALRVMLQARMQSADGSLMVSLAGGRKTMSSDMHSAASFFGCEALLHVISSTLPPDSVFFDPPASECTGILPFVSDRFDAHPLSLDLTPEAYPLPFPDINMVRDCVINGMTLTDAVASRSSRSGTFFVNYIAHTADNAMPFTGLYALPPHIFRALAHERIRGATDAALLRLLPKTDLHCHLGGVLSPEEIISCAMLQPLTEEELRATDNAAACCARAAAERSLDLLPAVLRQEGIAAWHRRDFKDLVPLHILAARCAAAFASAPDVFARLIYGDLLDTAFRGVGIRRYERLGDFQGSTLLQSAPVICGAVETCCRNAIADGVKYLELRCSPHKYTRGGMDALQVYRVIEQTLLGFRDRLSARIIIIASRHGTLQDIHEAVSLAESVLDGQGTHLLAGIDLAGDEAAREPHEVRELFLPLLERCLSVTIHAGETAPAESVWQAVYHLSAERIGHGLTLAERPDLLKKITDRRIGIELCPSSNLQITGMCLPGEPGGPVYPLQAYLDARVRVTVNTDNPGISRTSVTGELLRAAELTAGGLRLSDMLTLIRNGIAASFTEHQERRRLMELFDADICRIIREAFTA